MNFLQLFPDRTPVVCVTLFAFLRIPFWPHVCSVLLSHCAQQSHNKVFFSPDFCQSIQLRVRSPVNLRSLWLFCYFYTKLHVVFTCRKALCHNDGHVLTCCQFYHSFLRCSHHHHHYYLFFFSVTIVAVLTVITLICLSLGSALHSSSFDDAAPFLTPLRPPGEDRWVKCSNGRPRGIGGRK